MSFETYNLTGKIFTRLKVISQGSLDKWGNRRWFCKCRCKNILLVRTSYLNSGHTRSCGYLRQETSKLLNTIHGMRYTRIYNTWIGMRNRCYNLNQSCYKHYGGRGITICERWRKSFENFHTDMGDPPSSKHEMDRIDNNGDYEPGNCRWVTHKENCNNRRNQRPYKKTS